MANIVPARLQPTMCCIWPEMPQATYAFGDSIRPDTPTYSSVGSQFTPSVRGREQARPAPSLSHSSRARSSSDSSAKPRPAATTTSALFRSTPLFSMGLEETSFTGVAGATQATSSTAFAPEASAPSNAPAPTV